MTMTQEQTIYIMIIGFLQLTVLQFSEREKIGFGGLMWGQSEVLRWSVLTESGVNQKELS